MRTCGRPCGAPPARPSRLTSLPKDAMRGSGCERSWRRCRLGASEGARGPPASTLVLLMRFSDGFSAPNSLPAPPSASRALLGRLPGCRERLLWPAEVGILLSN